MCDVTRQEMKCILNGGHFEKNERVLLYTDVGDHCRLFSTEGKVVECGCEHRHCERCDNAWYDLVHVQVGSNFMWLDKRKVERSTEIP